MIVPVAIVAALAVRELPMPAVIPDGFFAQLAWLSANLQVLEETLPAGHK